MADPKVFDNNMCLIESTMSGAEFNNEHCFVKSRGENNDSLNERSKSSL